MEYTCTQSPQELPTHGIFEMQDLHPGMGTVIGTAMRRVLLSSVPGTAAVSMRIRGVSHEFATIPGVKEDVQELILRMRGLRLRISDRGIHSMTLHVKGRDALAADLTGDGSVEVLNPLYKIATLNETADLELELQVRSGRDHVPLERIETDPIGFIWLDPVFSPVERVSVNVEETDGTDHLRLAVNTNGVVSPREAVDWAGRILTEMTGGLSRSLISPPEKGFRALREVEGLRLETLGLSNRSYNRLKRAHFDTVEEVLSRSRQELYDTPALGPKTLLELEEKLSDLGLSFRENAG